MNIPVYKPLISEDEKNYLMDAITKEEISGYVGNYLTEFEEGFSRYSDFICLIDIPTNFSRFLIDPVFSIKFSIC